MSIIDRARDALDKATPGPWEYGENTQMVFAYQSEQEVPVPLGGCVAECVDEHNAALIERAPDYAAEVVRLHEQLGSLADDLHDAKVYDRGDSSGQAWWVASRSAAARIRAALEGDE